MSVLGPFGPGLFLRFEENSIWSFVERVFDENAIELMA
jgi:hypothetical protein